MVIPLPRIVLAAPGSGHGKTTVATGLMAALRTTGLQVAGFKIGPDYIDPGYHALATGRPGRNLDPHLCRPDQLVPLLLHGANVPVPADVAVVEGVMGLYDGRLGGAGYASTAHVASLITSPVVIVLDVSHLSRTAAAIVHGLASFDPALRIAGVIVNQAGSARHADEVCAALTATGVEVFGVLPRDPGVRLPARHLGLVPAGERNEAQAEVDRLAAWLAEHVDLARVLAAARTAPDLAAEPWRPEDEVHPLSGHRPVVAVAGGRAFTFRYAETEELLRAAGCEPVVFDPLRDEGLPDGTAGLYLGGGFPQVHATELSTNESMRAAVRQAVLAGIPTVAECAGLLYLCRSLDDQPMVDVLPATAAMTPRLVLGYRTAVSEHSHLLGEAGSRVTGHEFHRTAVTPSAGTPAGWLIEGRPSGFLLDPSGSGRPSVHASYLHTHWAGQPALAQRFADAVHAWAADHDLDLHRHGDEEVAPGLVDLAVNVRLAEPPDWLATVITAAVPNLGSYPDGSAARTAIAVAHGLPEDAVLPTAGAAEAFTLLARARRWRHPVVVHPQFTEPEAALIAAGHRPGRVMLSPDDGFRLDPALVPAEADLIVLGNPTNPTSVLHPAAVIASLARPGRVLCVDEAFLDAIPGEPESMINHGLAGLVVVRSVTKTWALAGLRAGYAVGDPAVITDLRRQQPHWSVSTPALAAITACLQSDRRRLATAAARELADWRQVLLAELDQVGLATVRPPAAPFVLAQSSGWAAGGAPGWVRLALRDQGFAVRLGDTFPGLGPDWFRIAVRDPDTSRALGKALRVIRDGRE